MNNSFSFSRMLSFVFCIVAFSMVSGCNDPSSEKKAYSSFDSDKGKVYFRTVKYMPTVCLNGVWYYSAEFVHNTYFAPVFTKKGVVAFCDGTQEQYVPE